MKRDVRIKLDFVITIDDERDGVPFVYNVLDFIEPMVRTIPNVKVVAIQPGAKVDIGLTRESMRAAKAKWLK